MEEALAEFVTFLERIIRGYGLKRIIGGTVVALGTLAGLGIAIQPTVVFGVLAIAAIAILFLSVLALFIDRRRLNREIRGLEAVAARYARDVEALQQTPGYFRVISWDEEMHISKEGDCKITRTMHLQAGAAPIQAFWHKCFKHASENEATRYRRHVQFEARLINDNLTEGTRFSVTPLWAGHSVKLYIHLNDKVQPNGEFRVRVEIIWPKYAEALLNGQTHPVEWTLRRPTDLLNFTMTLDKAILKKGPLVISPCASGHDPVQQPTPDGNLRITWTQNSPPIDQIVGFRLEHRDPV